VDLPRAGRCSGLLGASRIIAIVAGDFVGEEYILDLGAGSNVVDNEGPPVPQTVGDDPDMRNA